jgi:hypothetical protein
MIPRRRTRVLAASLTTAVLVLGTTATVARADDGLSRKAALIAALEAAGLSPEQIDDALAARIEERLMRLVEEGVIDEQQLDERLARVEELRASGELTETLKARVEEHRARQEERRQAIVDRLTELGIEVPEGSSLRDVLAEHGLSPRDLAPGRPDRPGRSEDDHGQDGDEADDDGTASGPDTSVEDGEDDDEPGGRSGRRPRPGEGPGSGSSDDGRGDRGRGPGRGDKDDREHDDADHDDADHDDADHDDADDGDDDGEDDDDGMSTTTVATAGGDETTTTVASDPAPEQETTTTTAGGEG